MTPLGIESILLSNALSDGRINVDKEIPMGALARMPSWFLGLCIGAIGVAVTGLGHGARLTDRLGEALVIAAVIAGIVDPYVKQRLLKEASKGIFHHLLGFNLPQPIQERLRKIVTTTDLYRKDMHIDCSFSMVDSTVTITFETRFEVINPTSHSIPFHQVMQFEKAESPYLERVALFGDDSYGKNDVRLTEEPGSKGFVMEYRGKEVKISPESSKKRYIFAATFSLRFPVPGVHVQHFGFPTIGYSLSARNVPVGLRIGASPATREDIDRDWIYDDLFMVGDHVQLRWEPITPSTSQTSADQQ